MKKIIFFFAVALMGCATVSQAQTKTLKLGYVNSQELLTLMPGAAKADTNLAHYMKQLDDAFQAMQQEGQQKLQEYQAQKNNWTEAVRETKEKGISDLQNRMQQFQANAQDSVQAKRNQLFQPLLDQAQKAIKAVGKEGNYDYIFDGSALLYANDAENLMPKVKAKLGIK